MEWNNKGHVFDGISDGIKGKNNVFVYGAGKAASELMHVLDYIQKWTKWNIFLVDQDEKKQQTGCYGRKVMSPDDFFSMEKKDFFVVAGADGEIGDEIYNILEKNLRHDVQIFKNFYFINTLLSIYFAYEHNMTYFGSENMLVSTACNLNCRDCLNFTPYIQNHHVETLDSVKNNVDLFFNAVDLIYRFQITGGEPLLFKELPSVIEYIGEKYQYKIISFELVTNGTIIPSDVLCQMLKKYNVKVFLDDYRNVLKDGLDKYNNCLNKLNEYDVCVVENYVEKWFRMYIPDLDENRNESEQELKIKYKKCNNPWSNLWNGQISSCNYQFYAYKAGLCDWDETGAYDLSEYNKSKVKELIEFRLRNCEKGYVSFCKNCNGWSDINGRWCEPAIQMKRDK